MKCKNAREAGEEEFRFIRSAFPQPPGGMPAKERKAGGMQHRHGMACYECDATAAMYASMASMAMPCHAMLAMPCLPHPQGREGGRWGRSEEGGRRPYAAAAM